MSRMQDLEQRLAVLQKNNPRESHHDCLTLVRHAIERLRKLEIHFEEEHRIGGEYDMATMRHCINESVNELEKTLEYTVEDWEHRASKEKKHFSSVD